MTTPAASDAWTVAPNYETFMGRWSRRIARQFLAWLEPPRAADWLEIGCGTGALTSTILAEAAPRTLLATEPSEAFLAHARATIQDPRVRFQVAGATKLPAADRSLDVVASGLVLNFVPDKPAALAEMRRVLKPGGLLSFYVWDYPGGGMGFITAFWQAVVKLDPAAGEVEHGSRFAFCTPAGLAALCQEAGLPAPSITPLEMTTSFADFEDFWQPFLLGAGPAGGYLARQAPARQAAIRAELASQIGDRRPIELPARAWAAKLRLAG